MARVRCTDPVVAIAALFTLACGGLASGSLRLRVHEEKEIRLSSAGAIVVNSERAGTLSENGRVLRQDGTLWAWLHNDSIRLPGGASIPIKADRDGNLYLPIEAQKAARLEPITNRVAKNGAILTKSGTATRLRIEGTRDLRSRRVGILLMLLLDSSAPTE